MARSAAENLSRGIDRRIVLGALGMGGVAIVGGPAAWKILFSGSHDNDGAKTPGADFVRPGDRGSRPLTEAQTQLLSRNYPEIGALIPKENTGYDSQFAHHDLLLYTSGLEVNTQSVDTMIDLDVFFAGNSALLDGQTYGGRRFSASVRPEVDSLVTVVPSHFPFPGEKAPAQPTNQIEWRYRIDQGTDAFFAAVRTPIPGTVDPKQHAIYLGDTLNAVSIAQTIDLVPSGPGALSPVEKKAIYEAMGDAVLAKSVDVSYGEHTQKMTERGYSWIVPGEMYEAIPKLKPIFIL